MDDSDLHEFMPDKKLLKKAMARPVAPESRTILDAIAERLFERLSLLVLSPSKIVDLGTGDARHIKLLQQQFKSAAVVGADISLARLQKATGNRRFWQKHPLLVCLDASSPLPFTDDSIDLVVSNMMLPWLSNAELLAAEINRILVKLSLIHI